MEGDAVPPPFNGICSHCKRELPFPDYYTVGQGVHYCASCLWQSMDWGKRKYK